jgi:ribosome maturation factor RimP
LSRVVDKQELIELLEPPLDALGYELVDLEVRAGRPGLLRLFIDREPAVTLADCELVSQQIGAFLDVEDPLPTSYVLEVSSPGIDRRLRTPQHFEAFVGHAVRVELKQPKEGRRKFKGRLAGFANETLQLEVEGQSWELPLDEIATARLAPEE